MNNDTKSIRVSRSVRENQASFSETLGTTIKTRNQLKNQKKRNPSDRVGKIDKLAVRECEMKNNRDILP